MVKFFASFNTIAFNRLFTFATFFSDCFPTFATIGFVHFFKEFPVNSSLTFETLKAFFVVNFAKSGTTFHSHRFFANATFSWNEDFSDNWIFGYCYADSLNLVRIVLDMVWNSSNWSTDSLNCSMGSFNNFKPYTKLSGPKVKILFSTVLVTRISILACTAGSF